MAELDQTFNAQDVPEDDRGGFDPLPAGEYTMQVIESEIKDTKSGSGQQLVLTLEVIEGQYSNRRVWDRLNIRNQNADAQRIAQRSLADLCLALNIQSLRNSEDLHFKPFIGKVAIRQDKTGQYGPQNTVRYKQKGGGAPRVAAPSTAPKAQTQQQPKPASGAKPWQRATA
jgi:hypothetical protein